MFIFLSACSLLVPLSMIILGYTWKDKPPKDRQGSSGYRTTMSRMNDETWRYAHRCWGWINFVLGIILVILSIFILILTKDDTNFEMISVYLVFLLIIPGLFEPPVRTLRATIPENESHIFR